MKRSPIAIAFASGLLLMAATSTAWAHNTVVSPQTTTQNQGVDECGFDGQQDGEFTDPNCDMNQTGADEKQTGTDQQNETQSGQDLTDTAQTGQQGASMEQDTQDGQQGDNTGDNEN